MILGSHNSWSYLSVKQWWLRPFSFIAKCQDLSIIEQYNLGVRCFDLRIRFDKNPNLKVCHGIFEYNAYFILSDLKWLNDKKDVYVRILHEVRTKKQYTAYSIKEFIRYIVFFYKN